LHGVLVDFGTTLDTRDRFGEVVVGLVFLRKLVIEEFIARFFEPPVVARHGVSSGLLFQPPASGKKSNLT
jgi:hypothetical protein